VADRQATPVIFSYLLLLFVAGQLAEARFPHRRYLMPPGQPYPYLIFLADYYQVFLPLSLLLRGSLAFRHDWIVLLVHVGAVLWSIRRLLRYVWRIARVPGPEAGRH